MGRRARGQGITNAALRIARAAQRERDEEAAAVAEHVYATARDLPRPGRVPLSIEAPIVFAAQVVAEGFARRFKVPPEGVAEDVAAYMMTVFITAYSELTPEVLEKWRAGVEVARTEAARRGASG